jgi:hypothetical protein
LQWLCYEAFRQVSDGHGFERDFPDADTASEVISLIQSLPGSFQVAVRLLAERTAIPSLS